MASSPRSTSIISYESEPSFSEWPSAPSPDTSFPLSLLPSSSTSSSSSSSSSCCERARERKQQWWLEGTDDGPSVWERQGSVRPAAPTARERGGSP
eukprot:scaffold249072_cov30-Tisochrysis_lutea.AAC.5